MDWSWLKRSMPRGLYGRAALILLLPVVVLQLVVAVVFIQRHFADVTRQMTASMLLELQHVINQVERAEIPGQALQDTAEITKALRIDLSLPSDPVRGYHRYFYDFSGKTIIVELRKRLEGLQSVDLTQSSREVRIQVATRHGPMSIIFDRRRLSASNPHQLLVLMVAIGVIMSAVAFVYLRNQLRPIKRLAHAAESFGKGRSITYAPSGAVEVRSAGNAFLDMRSRIERQTQQRTQMLSGVSHDLRTPLTRLKLGLSLLDTSDDKSREDMQRDLTDMEAMLDEFLDFARGDGTEEPVPTDPTELAQMLVENARRMGGDVSLRVDPSQSIPNIPLRPGAVNRAVSNLISNAMRYAQTARLSLDMTERTLRYTVEDDGPGIPEDQYSEAVRPFARLDAARNQDKGTGVGLGLSIALDVARSHGGMLRLGKSEDLGGLKAELVLAR